MNYPKPELYKTISREIVINGVSHSVQVTISTCIDMDYDPNDQDFDTDNHRQDFVDKFKSGMLEAIGVIVKASLCGETGTDSIWGNIVGDGYTVENVISEHGMTQNALIELQSNLKTQYLSLKNLFEVKP
jgi:hypothetical protein